MDKLVSDGLLLVFTYAPAGLGHLRVTDALYDKLPSNIHSVLLGTDDKRITTWHRSMSINPLLRNIMEWFQRGWRLELFSRFYIWTLNSSTKSLYRQLKYLIGQQWDKKKIIVVISTHFGLAHQIGHIKRRFEKETGTKIILIVQVTDATSMSIWYVKRADVIFVPSEKVKEELINCAKRRGFAKNKIEVLPYPISGMLTKKMSDFEYQIRKSELSHKGKIAINIAIPVSGAAVGLKYYSNLTREVRKISKRFIFHVVVRDNIHTHFFIQKMKKQNNVQVYSSVSDKETVDAYEKLYFEKVIAFEVVKPSEQSFKALLTPRERGGAILLLTEDVGKQEEDNLFFLSSHNLVPEKTDQQIIENEALTEDPSKEHVVNLKHKAGGWRGIRLTNSPYKDAKIIHYCLNTGIFSEMASYVPSKYDLNGNELGSGGVTKFWKRVEEIIANVTKKL